MPRNVEIKARVSSEQLAGVRVRAAARATGPSELLEQRDTFYRVPSGRLKLRELGCGRSELIAYQRPDRSGPKCSDYGVYACADAASLGDVLARALGVRGVVQKRREVVHVGQTRVHLDEVQGLGAFVELEVVLREDQSVEQGEAIARQLMQELGIAPESLVEGAYVDLLDALAAADAR